MRKIALLLSLLLMLSSLLPLLTSCKDTEGVDATTSTTSPQKTPPTINVDPALLEDFEYALLPDGGIRIDGYDSSKDIELVIPEGVTEIGDSAFSYCKNLQKITIPSSVRVIGEKAFNNCSSLVAVEFKANSQLTTIKVNAFSNVPLESITLPSKVSSVDALAFNKYTLLSIQVL